MLVRRNTITYPAWKPGRKTRDKIQPVGRGFEAGGVADQGGGLDEHDGRRKREPGEKPAA